MTSNRNGNAAAKPVLHLNLKSEYFYQIKNGEKKAEYRLKNLYWRKRLVGRDYDHILVKLGYPKNGDSERILKFPWLGYSEETILHKHFGSRPVQVFAIKLANQIKSPK